MHNLQCTLQITIFYADQNIRSYSIFTKDIQLHAEVYRVLSFWNRSFSLWISPLFLTISKMTNATINNVTWLFKNFNNSMVKLTCLNFCIVRNGDKNYFQIDEKTKLWSCIHESYLIIDMLTVDLWNFNIATVIFNKLFVSIMALFLQQI